MRKRWLALCLATCVLGASTPAPAGWFDEKGQFVGTVSPEITELLRVFPAGGPGLRAAIARAVEADPSLADDAVFVTGSANTCQRESCRAGLADAASSLANNGSAAARAAAQRIRAALGPGNPDTSVAACLLHAPDLAPGILGFSKAGPATSGCVSPSRPGC